MGYLLMPEEMTNGNALWNKFFSVFLNIFLFFQTSKCSSTFDTVARSCAGPAPWGEFPPNNFCDPTIVFCPENFFKHKNNKNFTPQKCTLLPQILKRGYGSVPVAVPYPDEIYFQTLTRLHF